MNGAPRAAVELLLSEFDATRNAKLLELALHTLERHHDEIDGADALQARGLALKSAGRAPLAGQTGGAPV